MAEIDPYGILGVSRSASKDEIKTSYRALARLYHPDMNGNSEVAQRRFREIVEAYDILRDTERRSLYDMRNPPPAPEDRHRGSGRARPFPRASLHRKAHVQRTASFSRGRETPGSSRASREETVHPEHRAARGWSKGSDLSHELEIDFLQALQGVTLEVRVLERTAEINIPAGIDTGARMRIPGQGAPGLRGGPNGDLFLNITVRDHPLFRREGDDIHVDIPVSVAEAALGSEIEVPGPEGRLKLKMPPGTQSGTKFRYKGKGFPSLGTQTRGAFYVSTHVVIPDAIDSASRELLVEFEKRNPFTARRGL
ncbi:MAG: DnaJ C-terminal domain-containing protein [Thermodesulfobacteriota bacterium]